MNLRRQPNEPGAVFRNALLIVVGLVAGLVVGYSLKAADRPTQSPPAAVTAQSAAPSIERGFAQAVARARPAVVNIYTSKLIPGRPDSPEELLLRRYFGLPDQPTPERAMSLGSGVILSDNGVILTNNHVVEGATEIAVSFSDGKSVPAKIVGADPETDLAVLKAERRSLPVIEFANSDQLRVGDIVLAIGNPFGVGQTVTHGIVSALGRKGLGINVLEDFIQTDAPINPGNSGGALIDTQGRLVGINDAIFSRSGGSQGIGFAIPVNLARQVADQLVRAGRVEHGWLGIEVADLDRESAAKLKLKESIGAVVVGIVKDGPAAGAGLRPGDVIVGIGGKTVRDANSLIATAVVLRPGQRVELSVSRNGAKLTLSLKTGRRPPMRAAAQSGQ